MTRIPMIQGIAPIVPQRRSPTGEFRSGSLMNAMRAMGLMGDRGASSAGPGALSYPAGSNVPFSPTYAGQAGPDPQVVDMVNRMLQGPPGEFDPMRSLTATGAPGAGGIPRLPSAGGTPPRQLGRGQERRDPLTIEELPPSRDVAEESMRGRRILPPLPRDMDAMKKEHQEDLYRSYGFDESLGGWKLPDHLDPPGQPKFFGGGWERHLRGRDRRLQDLRDIASGRRRRQDSYAPTTSGNVPFHYYGNRGGQGESFFGVGSQMARNRQAKLEEYWRRKEEGGNISRRRASQVARERRQMMNQMTDEEVVHNYGGRRAFAEEIIDPETGIVLEPETMYNPDSWRPILVTDARGRQKRKWIRKKPGGQTSKKISPRQEGRPEGKSSSPRPSLSGAVATIPADNDRGRLNKIMMNPEGSIISDDMDIRAASRAEVKRIIATASSPWAITYLTKLVDEHISRADQ